ncbi:conserved hypothetical protein [Trichinella spiralis]|uniref:hypothetical protein n=1 Tax=Trichinella spiralis TaxID=6334 RepID=UPI0001EFB8D2|nr:conserved hypothetical protein [Trichinella spiralis]
MKKTFRLQATAFCYSYCIDMRTKKAAVCATFYQWSVTRQLAIIVIGDSQKLLTSEICQHSIDKRRQTSATVTCDQFKRRIGTLVQKVPLFHMLYFCLFTPFLNYCYATVVSIHC